MVKLCPLLLFPLLLPSSLGGQETSHEDPAETLSLQVQPESNRPRPQPADNISQELDSYIINGMNDGTIAVPADGAWTGGAAMEYQATRHVYVHAVTADTRPSDLNKPPENIFESFYRLRLTQLSEIGPDVQVLVHPSNRPALHHMVILNTRMRIFF
jgi:hypothetical protein